MATNVQKLIILKVSIDAIPAKSTKPLIDGIDLFQEPGKLAKSIESATIRVYQAIDLLRKVKEPNPWRDKSDEEIAGDLLARIEKIREEKNRNPSPG